MKNHWLRKGILKFYADKALHITELAGDYAGEIALLVDNQKLFTEIRPCPFSESFDYLSPVRRELVEEEITAKSRMLKTSHRVGTHNEIAKNIAIEITHEIVTDLRLNAGTVANWKWTNARDLFRTIMELRSIVHRKTLNCPANWIYTGPEIGRQYASNFGVEIPDNNKEIYRVSNTGDMALYIDKLFPSNQVLIGLREQKSTENRNWKYNAGYIYAPYIPMSLTDNQMIITRYAKRLTHDGSKYYARLTVTND